MEQEGRSNVLPSVPLPTDTIDINGQEVRFRSLSRAETLKLTTQFKDDPDSAEIFVLACGTGVSLDQAKQWRDETDPTTAGKLVDGIIILTGLAKSEEAKN